LDYQLKQKEHYNKIAEKYALHYGDKYSQMYRKRFVYDRLLSKNSFTEKKVLEAMAGSGESSEYLLSRSASLYSLDISFVQVEELKRRFSNSNAVCGSILKTGFKDQSFDSIVVIGGLHHLHPRLYEAIEEIYRLLKRKGKFFFFEPHKGSLPDFFRRIWYKHDPLFVKNEESINIDSLIKDFSQYFHFKNIEYHGNIAYLLIYNSMILRIPLWIKKIYAIPILSVEKLVSSLETKFFSFYSLVKAEKK